MTKGTDQVWFAHRDRLLQDETQTSESKGLSRCQYCADRCLGTVYFDMRCDGCLDRLFDDEISDAQVRDQDSLFGCLPEEKK